MKKLLLISVLGMVMSNSYADYGAINCTGKGIVKSVDLSLDETSEVNKDTVGLNVEKVSKKIASVKVSQTDYGILSINVQVGTGPGKYNYIFQNLGSSQCFGVYGSEQKGSAYVQVVNSMGTIAKLNCRCDQD